MDRPECCKGERRSLGLDNRSGEMDWVARRLGIPRLNVSSNGSHLFLLLSELNLESLREPVHFLRAEILFSPGENSSIF